MSYLSIPWDQSLLERIGVVNEYQFNPAGKVVLIF